MNNVWSQWVPGQKGGGMAWEMLTWSTPYNRHLLHGKLYEISKYVNLTIPMLVYTFKEDIEFEQAQTT